MARTALQTLIAAGVLGISVVLAWGALAIPSAAGYTGVGPNFLPWLIAVAMFVCGVLLMREALRGGFRSVEAPSGAARGDWTALAWVAAGLLANAALITRIGFVFACSLAFMLAVRGLRRSEGSPAGGVQQTLVDAAIALAITLPVYWLFVRLLGINLPALTASGWL